MKLFSHNIRLYLLFYGLIGSPFHTKITDRSRVSLMDDLTDLMDENGHLALVCNQETRLHYDITDAGPGMYDILKERKESQKFIYFGSSLLYVGIIISVKV